ncbi:hypothetical protein WH52_01585 [Tenacibaculum holothuriorum]|uniref:Glycosyl transferase family 1 domain-containing protein n=2 Tax=Tenacibaculum holothuriorum TaxID=1635173 RepID=A0A1Y2PFU6_9FLAO|nr:hypothetical protein WH52_01585 [Tenacibaculum holothuriorum]
MKDEGYSISLIAHPKVIQQSKGYKSYFSNIIEFDGDSKGKRLQKSIQLFKLLKGYDKVIFNTASSSKIIRNVVFLLNFKKTSCVGVIHDVSKLENSFTQKVISTKIKKYIALSNDLAAAAKVPNDIKLASFYPIFFPNHELKNVKKNKEEIWICIPGRIFFTRRDYRFLIEQLAKKTNLDSNIKFIILGNINTTDGIQFKNEIHDLNIQSYFMFFDGFIENDTYYNYLHSSDYILPLLNKNDKSYVNQKITGTFNLAYAYKKTMLNDEYYKVIPNLLAKSYFYTDDSFINVLNSLSDKEGKQYEEEKWTYEFQQQQYINFLNS